MEKQRKLVRREDADALIDEICGIVLTHLSGMGAALHARPAIRRNIDAVVHRSEPRWRRSATKMADERGEPPLDQQEIRAPVRR